MHHVLVHLVSSESFARIKDSHAEVVSAIILRYAMRYRSTMEILWNICVIVPVLIPKILITQVNFASMPLRNFVVGLMIRTVGNFVLMEGNVLTRVIYLASVHQALLARAVRLKLERTEETMQNVSFRVKTEAHVIKVRRTLNNK